MKYDFDGDLVEDVSRVLVDGELIVRIKLKSAPRIPCVFVDSSKESAWMRSAVLIHKISVGIPGCGHVGHISHSSDSQWMLPTAECFGSVVHVKFRNKNSIPPRITGTIE